MDNGLETVLGGYCAYCFNSKEKCTCGNTLDINMENVIVVEPPKIKEDNIGYWIGVDPYNK